jgi:phosphate transport system permease protein
MTALSTTSLQVPALIGQPRSRASRAFMESSIRLTLFACGGFSILITFAIIVVLFGESLKFFSLPDVTFSEFAFGTRWSPLLGAQKHFGVWPLVCGTMVVGAVAAVFALPCGAITAIYLSEYAPRSLRAILKPVLEILAGIPTVVYGFFALTVITPALREIIPGLGTYNAIGAGLAVGIMVLPIVCSLSEDALQAVPRTLREGAYAVGATKFDVSLKVVTPAALSGIIASFLLAISRAIGETMIVAMAAGGLARSFTNFGEFMQAIDPRNETQTMTAYMVQIFLGDTATGGVEYRSCYAVAATLFVITFGLAILGNRILKRFREVYE